ncbi:MAG: HIT family protein [Minisyncoccia bacterium]
MFCKIIKGKEPARIIYEDKDVICFLPKTIQVYGHTLIVPKSIIKTFMIFQKSYYRNL